MKKQQQVFHLSIQKYLQLIELSFLHPDQYSKFLKEVNLKQSFFFFLFNGAIWLLFSSFIRTILIGKNYLFFSILSEIFILGLLLFPGVLFFALILHFFSKIFGGRAKFQNNLKAVFFSSTLLPFFAVPVFKILALAIYIFTLIFCIKTVNRFDKVKASLIVIIPVGITIAGLISLNIINVNLLIR